MPQDQEQGLVEVPQSDSILCGQSSTLLSTLKTMKASRGNPNTCLSAGQTLSVAMGTACLVKLASTRKDSREGQECRV
jgi:hypothetical protein